MLALCVCRPSLQAERHSDSTSTPFCFKSSKKTSKALRRSRLPDCANLQLEELVREDRGIGNLCGVLPERKVGVVLEIYAEVGGGRAELLQSLSVCRGAGGREAEHKG